MTLLTATLLSATNARAQDNWAIGVLCDSATSRLRIGDTNAPDWSTDAVSMQLMEVEWPGWAQGKGQTRWGNTYRGAPLKPAVRHCGRLTMKLKTEYLNSDPDGDLGVVIYETVEVWLGRLLIVPKTGLYLCDADNARFGKCPDLYARNILISLGSASTSVSIRRTYSDGVEERDRTDQYQVRHARGAQ